MRRNPRDKAHHYKTLSVGGTTAIVETMFPGNTRACRTSSRVQRLSEKLASTSVQLNLLTTLRAENLLPKHLTNMYFPKLFPDLSTLNIDEPLQSIDLD